MAYETILKGFKLLKHPEEATNFWLNFIVLVIAVIIDGAILMKAMKEIMKETRVQASGFALFARRFQNAGRLCPPTRLVFYEDIVATLGALFALIAIVFAHFFNFLILDGIATILIGCLMVGVAFKVGYDNMVGLIGVAARMKWKRRSPRSYSAIRMSATSIVFASCRKAATIMWRPTLN